MSGALEGLALSPQQRRLWGLQAEGRGFRSRAAVVVRGELSPDLLQVAWTAVVARHEILRTAFRSAPGIRLPVQAIGNEAIVAIEIVPAAGTAVAEAVAALWVQAEEDKEVDLGRGPLHRLRLAALAPGLSLLLLDLPALCADRASVASLVHEIARAAAGRLAPDPPLQYGDLSQWMNELLEAEETEPGRAHWQGLDLASLADTRLPGARRPARGDGFAPRSLDLRLAPKIAARLGGWCSAQGLPPSAFLLAAWRILLGRLTGQADLLVAAFCDGRRYEELADAVGLFARFLPLRCRVQGRDRFSAVLRRLDTENRETVLWQEVFDREPPPGRDGEAGRWPFGFEYDEAAPPFEAGGLSFEIVRLSSCLEPCVARLVCVRHGEEIAVELCYDESALDPAEARRLAERFESLLASAAQNPEAEIADLDLLAPAERQLLAALGETAAPYPEESSVYALFAATAAREPGRIAVVCGASELTYADLAARAETLARRLAALGVGPEARVGICLERSPEMVVALLAVLRAGGAYVPLDPGHPRERLGLLVADAGLAVLLTRESLAPRLPAGAARVLCLDSEWGETAEAHLGGRGAGPDSLAYVLYTSGSTGKPKGVMVPQRGAVHYLSWCLRAYGLTAGERVPVHSPLTFDLTVTSLLAPLVAGATVELLPESGSVEALAGAVRAGGLGLLKLTPAHLQALEQLVPAAELAGKCRALVVGGESLLAGPAGHFREHAPGTRLINEYGPTETVVGCATYEIPPEGALRTESGSVPIGRPIQNTRLHLLDGCLWPAPLGTVGEIHVGGPGVARGYLGDPERTASSFVPDPWSERPGARLYRTGDLARHLPTGDLEFLGRRDDQVKIRGYRIELGEIESALLHHPGISEAAVVAREDEPGDRRLVAYVVGRGGSAPTHEELLRHLQERLPEPMLPSAFVALPSLPWTAHGKVDRRALPAPERAASTALHVPPRSPIEETLAGIWGEVLDRERIGVHDDFFRLGGHSMKAAQVVAKVRKRLAVEVSLQELFDAPTVAALAARIATRERRELEIIEPVPEAPSYPLSHAQKRLWFLAQQLDEAGTAYNVLGAYVFAEDLDEALLRRVFTRLTARHESLRTTFVSEDGEPRQVIHPESGFRLEAVDLRGNPDREERAREYAREEARIPFDLERGPLFRARLLRLEERRSVLLFTLHHIVSDGWSMQVLFREFFLLYRAFSAGHPDPLEPLRIQYKDCAAWEARKGFERERRYWREKLAGPLDLIRLPFDFPSKEIYDFSGAVDVALLSAEASRHLDEIAFAHETTPSNVLLTGFVIFLWRLTEQPDLALAMTTANRNHADLLNIVGFFVNSLVLSVHLDETAEFSDVLRQVAADVHEALGYQSYPFDLLVEERNPPRRGNRQPLFNVCYAFQSFDDLALGDARIDDMRGELSEVADLGERRPTSKFDLTLFAGRRDGRYVLTFEYSTELFLPQSMRGHLDILRRFLETIAGEAELRASRAGSRELVPA